MTTRTTSGRTGGGSADNLDIEFVFDNEIETDPTLQRDCEEFLDVHFDPEMKQQIPINELLTRIAQALPIVEGDMVQTLKNLKVRLNICKAMQTDAPTPELKDWLIKTGNSLKRAHSHNPDDAPERELADVIADLDQRASELDPESAERSAIYHIRQDILDIRTAFQNALDRIAPMATFTDESEANVETEAEAEATSIVTTQVDAAPIVEPEPEPEPEPAVVTPAAEAEPILLEVDTEAATPPPPPTSNPGLFKRFFGGFGWSRTPVVSSPINPAPITAPSLKASTMLPSYSNGVGTHRFGRRTSQMGSSDRTPKTSYLSHWFSQKIEK